jgi:hypothetical protein
MAYLKLPSQTPPGGWIYFQSETRKWFSGDQGVIALAEEIALHRQYRELPRATADEALEDIHEQICNRLGPEHCRPNKGEDWRPIKRDFTRNLESEQAVGFTRGFIEFVKGHGEMVALSEMNRRAEICRGCNLNMKAEGCAGCSALFHLINAAMPSDRQPSGLDICAACGCGLKAKVNMPVAVIEAADAGRDLVYPEWCWNNPESSAYSPF